MNLFRTAAPLSNQPSASPAAQGCELRYPTFPSPRIRGCIDGLFNDELRGWVVDESDPNRYIALCLFANGMLIEKTSACVFRKDLEQLFHSKGLHGFCFRLPDRLREQSEVAVEIRLEDSRQLCPPTLLRNPTPTPPSPAIPRNPCLLVMHIPKTAVTAVRSALRSDWLTDRQLWLYGDPPGFPPEHLLFLNDSQLRRAECIFGHFSYGIHSYLPQPAHYATILREPVDRCISHYFHQRAKSLDPNAPERLQPLDNFLRSCSDVAYDNLMVRMFTGKAALPIGSVTRHLLGEAIDNIHRHFCYLGFQQRTSEAVASLAGYLGLQPNPLQMENLGQYPRESCASPFAVRKLREFNRFDLELCHYVQQHFWSTGSQGWVRGRTA